jgi:hypothetical protein
VNAEQASKRDVAEADPAEFRGRPMPLGETATAPSGSVGVMASACLEEEIVETREALAVAARDRQPDSGDGLAWAAEGDGEVRSSDEAG